MEVLGVLLLIIFVGVALYYLSAALLLAGLILMYAWPAIIGVGLAVYLWPNHDNIAVVVAILGVIGNGLWVHAPFWGESSSYDWRDGLKRRYNRDGEVIGYEDRD